MMTVWTSIARCLSTDEDILPGSDGEFEILDDRFKGSCSSIIQPLTVDDGILGSEVIPNVASFDLDCILASHEDGINGSTSKVRLPFNPFLYRTS